jgi:hypothetical protein
MNKQPLTTEQTFAVQKVQMLFIDWRKTKAVRDRIPDRLWQAAADLYHTLGVSINRIALALRLNYSTLKSKILDIPVAAIDSSADDAPDMFIELAPGPVCTDCIIEMENKTGVKMRMRFAGRADPAVISLGKYFLAGVP